MAAGRPALPDWGQRPIDAATAHTLTERYYCNPGATAAFHDGWQRTGDLARVDDDGYLFIVDRLKSEKVMKYKLREPALVPEAG